MDITLGGAILAGLLSFLSPCVLPMLPFYLCYLAGLSMPELRAAGGVSPRARRRLVLAAVCFALGVTTIFVILGLGATALGQALRNWRGPLSWLAAALLAGFGLHMLGLLRLPWLDREARLAGAPCPASLPGAYAMGLAFGFGWTPCVGPALAAILLLAAGSESLARGAALLLAYGLAMTAPFVVAAIALQPVLGWTARHRRLLAGSGRVMGALLILFALLIATDRVGRLAQWLLDAGDWSPILR